MPVTVRKGKGARPWKIVEIETGRQVGSSATKAKAARSAAYRNAAYRAKGKL